MMSVIDGMTLKEKQQQLDAKIEAYCEALKSNKTFMAKQKKKK